MADPVVYGPGFSTYTRSVRLALEEKGAGYRLHEVDILHGEGRSPEHLARHPFGKVPAFEHDGFRLYETAAINRYVDEVFDGPALQPSDARERARMVQIVSLIDAYGYPVLIGRIVMQRVVMPLLEQEPDQAVLAEAAAPAETVVRALDGLIADSAFAAGGELSLADLHLMPVLDYLVKTPEGDRLLAAAPNLARWWGEVRGRPSLERTAARLG